MALDHGLVGVSNDPVERSWGATDAILYVLVGGAGDDNALRELNFTTENTSDLEQKVLPTFAVLAAQAHGARHTAHGDCDPAKLVHVEQCFELHRPLPVEATMRVTSTVTGMHDEGSGAPVTTEAVAVDVADDQPAVTSRGGIFIRCATRTPLDSV